ncbi:MAG: hypothetical protein R2794_01545 [Chitinophagales bacterium]
MCTGHGQEDPLRSFRELFHMQSKAEKLIYFCGNSLGLQPRSTRQFIEQELSDWETLGVEGHLHAKKSGSITHHFLADQRRVWQVPRKRGSCDEYPFGKPEYTDDQFLSPDNADIRS